MKAREIGTRIKNEMKRLKHSGGAGDKCFEKTLFYVALLNIADNYAPLHGEQEDNANNLRHF